jgi:hypothetical protein
MYQFHIRRVGFGISIVDYFAGILVERDVATHDVEDLVEFFLVD